MPTIREVAQLAGVSIATVSAVLNKSAYVSPELTARVQRAANDLSYTVNAVARGLQSRSTRLISMLVPDVAEPVYALMVRGVERALKDAGYSLLLGSTHNRGADQSRYLELLRSKQVDGMILLLAFGAEDEVRAAVEARFPIVFMARPPRSFRGDVVMVDNKAGACQGVVALARKGHKRIGLIIGPRELAVSRQRIDGWRHGHAETGLVADDRLIFEGDYTRQSGEAAIAAFASLDAPPTAVFSTGFLMATGCIAACRQRGLEIPGEIEMMTWSDSPLLDIFRPPVSSVEQPSAEMGEAAAQLILRRIKNRDLGPQEVVLATRVQMRE